MSELAELPVIDAALDDDWISQCGVCGGDFAIRNSDSPEIPSRNGTFCPDCRERGLMAPGVLHWSRRATAIETQGGEK